MLGAAIVLGYTLWGGMWSVALTDLFQSVDHHRRPALHRLAGGRHGGRRRRVIAARRRGRASSSSGRKVEARGVARFRRRLGDAGARLDPAAGRVPARHLGEEREHRGARLPARRRASTSASPSCRSSSPTAALLIDPGMAKLFANEDAREIQRILPNLILRAHAAVGAGAVLRRAALGDPVHRQRRAARADARCSPRT